MLEAYFIPGFGQEYKITYSGTIISCKKSVEIPLHPWKSASGYLYIDLSIKGKKSTFRVNRLVALCWIPNPKNKPEVNHIDGDKENNKVSNLEWATHLENMQHAKDTGLLPNRVGSNNGRAKLNEYQVISIRVWLLQGFTQKEISKVFNVSICTISDIKLRKTWTHLKE